MKKSIMNIMRKQQDKPIVHLHIGTHKTGTTSLQRFLDINSEQLKKYDILYPKTGWYHHSQHLLPFQLKGAIPFDVEKISDTVWQDLIKEIKRSRLKNVILSSEIFSTLNKSQIEILHKYLEDFEVKIYLYLRRQDELFESIYNQQIKGWRNPKKKQVSFFLKNMKALYPHFNYFHLVKNWAEVFKSDNIIIRPYHKEYVSDTISDFLNLLEIDDKEQKKFQWPKNGNRSISIKALELIRLSKFVEEDLKVREKIFHLANKIFPPTSSNKTLLDTEQKNKITEKFKSDNNNLIKHYFALGESYLLAPSPTGNEKEILTKEDLLRVIASIVSDDIQSTHLKIFDKLSRVKK